MLSLSAPLEISHGEKLKEKTLVREEKLKKKIIEREYIFMIGTTNKRVCQWFFSHMIRWVKIRMLLPSGNIGLAFLKERSATLEKASGAAGCPSVDQANILFSLRFTVKGSGPR